MRTLLLLLALSGCLGGLEELDAEPLCVVQGLYRFERVPVDPHCGDVTIGLWEVAEAQEFSECLGVWASPELGRAAVVCEPGDPSLRCWASTMEDGCPYRRIMAWVQP